MSKNLDVKYDLCRYDIVRGSIFKDGRAICRFKDFYDLYESCFIDENFFKTGIHVNNFDNDLSDYNEGYYYDKYYRQAPGSWGLDYNTYYDITKFDGNSYKKVFDRGADLVLPICNDRSFIKNDGKYYLVDSKFKRIKSFDYIIDARRFGNNISYIKVFDKDIYSEYHKITNKSIASYIENMASFFAIDVNGNRINDLEFDDCSYFSSGRCFVKFKGNDYYSLIDTNFNVISDLKIMGSNYLCFNGDFLLIEEYESGEKYFIDKNGKRCSKNYSFGYCDLPNNYFVVRDEDYWCILDCNLNVISKLEDPEFNYYFNTCNFSNYSDYFYFDYQGSDEAYVVIFDKDFNLKYTYDIDDIYPFGSNGLMPIKLDNGNYGYVDLDFNLVSSKVYEYHVSITTWGEVINVVSHDIDDLKEKMILELKKLIKHHKRVAYEMSGDSCSDLIKYCNCYVEIDNEINELINSLNGNTLEEKFVYTKK